jgi:hypothetical protein
VYDALVRRAQRRQFAIALVIAVVAAATAAAQPSDRPAPAKVTVALLPLDAEPKLALYGQPVAAELSRALAAEGLDVAMVGQGDPVPTRAVLVVDGTIRKQGKGIVLDLRVRDPVKAEELAVVSAGAASLTAIDKAAAAVARRLVPKVRELLAARAKPEVPDRGSASGSAAGSGTAAGSARPVEPPQPVVPTIVLVASSQVALDGRPDAMVAAVVPAFERLIVAARHRPIAAQTMISDRATLAHAVASAGAEFGVSVDLLALDIEPGRVPVARARARVRIVDGNGTWVFDRVVRTDTLVGNHGEVAAHMAGYAGAQLAEVVRSRLLVAARGAAP